MVKKATPRMVSTPQTMVVLPTPDERLVRASPGPDVMLTPRAGVEIEEWIAGWVAQAELEAAGVSRPGPLLLYGPTGTGKTSVTRMVARRLEGVKEVFVVDAMRVVSSFLGETSANIAKAASAAIRSGGVLVLEEIDALASSRTYETSAAVENTRSTTSIMRTLELEGPMILTSNRLDVLDPAIVRRCEYIVEMPTPTHEQRREIVERELGTRHPFAIPTTVPLSSAIALARRARRVAVVSGRDVVSVFSEMMEFNGLY